MADLGRLLQAFSAIVRETLPNLDYFGVYLYEVFSWNESAQTADLKPVGNQKLPQVTGVQARLPAMQVKLAPGDQVLVGFQDGNSSQPFIAQLSYSSSYATALNAARQGDIARRGRPSRRPSPFSRRIASKRVRSMAKDAHHLHKTVAKPRRSVLSSTGNEQDCGY